jgi:hypothetical protein
MISLAHFGERCGDADALRGCPTGWSEVGRRVWAETDLVEQVEHLAGSTGR